MRKEYDLHRAKRGAVVKGTGKQRITIMLDGDVLSAFRDRAAGTRRGYQALINQALRDYIAPEVTIPFYLRIQDPNTDANTMLELLAESSATSDHGAGIFSFASARGISLLLNDPTFNAFLGRGEFELIVGVDAVTTPSALTLLRDAEDCHPGLRTRVFLHNRQGALFHPKVCWFIDAKSGRLFTGSGNLTRGGLLNNWEAFSDIVLPLNKFQGIFDQWSAWISNNEPLLHRPDDEVVISRAKLNESDTHRRHEEDMVEDSDDSIHVEIPGAEILIAEIPRSASRWRQANFDRTTFTEFFQLQPNTNRRIVLFPVESDGTVGEVEIRPSVSVKSSNFRIELGLASRYGHYPDNGRPIGIFKKIGTRRFRYRLVMPDHSDHTILDTMLSKYWNGILNRIRRIHMKSEEFRSELAEFVI